MLQRSFVCALAIAAALGAVSSAFAGDGTLLIEGGNIGDHSLALAGYWIGAYTIDYTPNVGSTTAAYSGLGFCTDLGYTSGVNSGWPVNVLTTASYSSPSQTGSFGVGPNAGPEIAYLANTYAHTGVGASTQAAVALAIWKIGGWAGTTEWANVESALAAAESTSTSTVDSAINGYIADAAAHPGTATWYKAEGSENQAFVRPGVDKNAHVTATPEPFTMGLGIAGVLVAVRRRARAK